MEIANRSRSSSRTAAHSQPGFEFDSLFEFSPDQTEEEIRLELEDGQTVHEDILRGATRRVDTGRPSPYSGMRTTNKLEKSRQSARECRARKKLRYQYLDDMILEREKANDRLREELGKYVGWCQMLDQSQVPDGLQDFLNNAAPDYLEQEHKC